MESRNANEIQMRYQGSMCQRGQRKASTEYVSQKKMRAISYTFGIGKIIRTLFLVFVTRWINYYEKTLSTFLSWNDLVLARLDKQKLIVIEYSWWSLFRISLGFKDNKKRKQQVNDWARKDKILKATADKVGEEEIILRFMSGGFTLMLILSWRYLKLQEITSWKLLRKWKPSPSQRHNFESIGFYKIKLY